MQLCVLSSCCMAHSRGPHKCCDAGGLRQDPNFTPNAFYGAAVLEEAPTALRAPHPAAAALCCQGPAQNPTGWFRCHPLSLLQMLVPCRNATFGVLGPTGRSGWLCMGQGSARRERGEAPRRAPPELPLRDLGWKRGFSLSCSSRNSSCLFKSRVRSPPETKQRPQRAL